MKGKAEFKPTGSGSASLIFKKYGSLGAVKNRKIIFFFFHFCTCLVFLLDIVYFFLYIFFLVNDNWNVIKTIWWKVGQISIQYIQEFFLLTILNKKYRTLLGKLCICLIFGWYCPFFFCFFTSYLFSQWYLEDDEKWLGKFWWNVGKVCVQRYAIIIEQFLRRHIGMKTAF